MKKIIFIISVFFATIVSGQNIPGDYNGQKMLEDLWYKFIPGNKLINIEGSPYYDKNFKVSKISGYSLEVQTRYNSFLDAIEFLKDGETLLLPKNSPYNEIYYPETNERLFLINDNYYFLIYDGKNYKAYKKVQTKYQGFEKAKSGYEKDKPAKFYNVDDSFFIMIKDALVKIPNNRKKILELFPNKTDELNKFLKEKSIDLKNKNDLYLFMQFIDK